MRQVILYSAASLDNFIARPDGNLDWLHRPEYIIPDEDFGYQRLLNSIDTTLMGNKTYQVIACHKTFPYTDKINYVFTRTSMHCKNKKHIQFISDDIPEFVKQLKSSEGQDIWLIGGGEINSLLLKHNLIDQLILTVIPVFLGEGIPLFRGDIERSFFQQKVEGYKNGIVQLSLRAISSSI